MAQSATNADPFRAGQDDVSETELVHRFNTGDPDAFGELVQVTWGKTYALALSITGNQDDALDVCQDAYRRAYRGLKKFRGDSLFTTWLNRITINCAKSHLDHRNRNRHEELGPVDAVDTDYQVDPEAATVRRFERDQARRQVRAALSELEPKIHAVVVLRVFYDLSHAEIAKLLGISVENSKVRFHRGFRTMRTRLNPRYVPPSSKPRRRTPAPHPDLLRRVLDLREVKGMGIAEICSEICESPNRVKHLLQMARKMFKKPEG